MNSAQPDSPARTPQVHAASSPAEASTADLVRRLTEQVRTLVTDEVALAKAELTEKGKRVGVGAGLAGAAAVFALGAGLAFIAAAIAALALILPVWAAALIVGGVLLLVAGILGLAGKGSIQKGSPPVPTAAIDSTKQDVRAVAEEVRR